MTISEATNRSREIRKTILRLLYNAYQANPDIGLLADHVYSGFSTSVFIKESLSFKKFSTIESTGIGGVTSFCFSRP